MIASKLFNCCFIIHTIFCFWKDAREEEIDGTINILRCNHPAVTATDSNMLHIALFEFAGGNNHYDPVFGNLSDQALRALDSKVDFTNMDPISK